MNDDDATGRDCKFSHVVDGSLQRVSSSTRETTVAPGAFGKQCKFFDYGGCAAGDRCPYLHEVKSEGADNNSKKKSSAKAYVINPNTKNAPATASPAAPSSDDKEEKAAAWTGAQPESLDQQQVTELSDFISKEEGASLLPPLLLLNRPVANERVSVGVVNRALLLRRPRRL